jgi:hypothetical protein
VVSNERTGLEFLERMDNDDDGSGIDGYDDSKRSTDECLEGELRSEASYLASNLSNTDDGVMPEMVLYSPLLLPPPLVVVEAIADELR